MERGFKFALLFLGLHAFLTGTVESSHFRGVSISWRATDDPNQIDINWWIAWRRSIYSNECDETHIGNDTLVDSRGEVLKCDQCSSRNIANLDYQCTDYSVAEDWQSGVGHTNFTIDPGLTSFDISFDNCCWISIGNGGQPSYGAQAHVDLSPRANGVINSSPVTSWVPIYRIQRGCNATLNIPVSDPDGDEIKCRWPSSSAERGGTTQIQNAVLNPSTCVVTIDAASLSSGWYAIALMVEDFATPSSVTAMSKVPLQFLVNVYMSNINSACDDRPVLIAPSPAQGSCYGLAPGETFSAQIRARASHAQIIEMETTSPVGMTTTAVSLVPGKTDEYYIMATWTPTDSQMGTHIFCFNALDSDGFTSEVRCVYLTVKAPLSVIQSWPSEGSLAPTNLGVWTFKFNQSVTIETASTSMIFRNQYNNMWMFSGRVTQVSPDTIQVRPQGTLSTNSGYSVSLSEGVVKSTDSCPVLSEGYDVNVYTTWWTGSTTPGPIWTDASTANYPHSSAPKDWTTPAVFWETTTSKVHKVTTNQLTPPHHGNTQPPPSPTMDCSDSGMTVFIPRSVIGDALASHLHFLDPACVGSHHNASHVKIATTYNRCGTFMEVRGENVIFFNVIHDEAVPVTPGGVITRDRDIEIPVQCIMDLEGVAEINFRPDTSKITFREDGFGSFNFSLRMYRGNDYATPYQPADYPVDVTMGDKMYFEARTWSEPGLELFVQTCRATPTSNPDDFHRYTFIQDGCIEDNTMVFRPSYDPDVERFEIEVFSFVDTLPQPLVYVHCDMILCNSSDASSRCALGCPTGNINSLLSMRRRHARSASGSRAYAITQGPISVLKQEEEKEAKSKMSSVQLPVLLTTVCLLVGCVLVLGALVAAMRKRNPRPYAYQPLLVNEED
ncbi:uncharacterized protein LOC119732968 [Patiria miniata]|uniref:ZP domain-containing protein n=1 Tax=Patiria miniata TaxID=46514 RepID=A0A914AEU6_PATMI|nr:uncharacterized protein LOC119732968 [Patiria miniata]